MYIYHSHVFELRSEELEDDAKKKDDDDGPDGMAWMRKMMGLFIVIVHRTHRTVYINFFPLLIVHVCVLFPVLSNIAWLTWMSLFRSRCTVAVACMAYNAVGAVNEIYHCTYLGRHHR